MRAHTQTQLFIHKHVHTNMHTHSCTYTHMHTHASTFFTHRLAAGCACGRTPCITAAYSVGTSCCNERQPTPCRRCSPGGFRMSSVCVSFMCLVYDKRCYPCEEIPAPCGCCSPGGRVGVCVCTYVLLFVLQKCCFYKGLLPPMGVALLG